MKAARSFAAGLLFLPLAVRDFVHFLDDLFEDAPETDLARHIRRLLGGKVAS